MFAKELREIALKHAPQPTVKVGDIVTTQWAGWKHPHKVKISEIGVHIVSRDSRSRKENEPLEQWVSRVSLIGVDLYYCALRLRSNGEPKDKDGCGINLINFVDSSGNIWQEKNTGFNHVGLSWTISRLPKG